MNKPPIEKVLKILAMKKQASDLYEKIDQKIAELHKEFGPGRFDYDLDDLPTILTEVVFEKNFGPFGDGYDGFGFKIVETNSIQDIHSQLVENGQYLKFEIIDNLEALASGQPVFKSTSISPLSFSSGSLKRQPKSLLPEMEQEDE